MLRGAIFGFGNIGQFIARSVNVDKKYGDRAKIVTACDRYEKQRKIAENEFGIKAYADPQKMFENDLDFVCVVSTSIAHKEHVLMSVERNLPILCEKPLALNLHDAITMVNEIEKRKLPNVVRYLFRFTSEYRALKQMVDDGIFGDLLSVWARNFRGYGLYAGGTRHIAVMRPEESGGWIVHHACHMADIMLWLGGAIKEVYCQTHSTVPYEDSEEIIWSNVTFENGAIGMIADTVACLEDKSIGVIGKKGSATIMTDCIKPVIKYRKEGEADFAPPHIFDPMDMCPSIDSIAHFFDCIQHDEKPIATVRDAVSSLAVAIAMKKSAVEKRPVTIAEALNI